MPENKRAILIAGPTASGKSALAVEMAKKHDGLVINADSMQVYNILKEITARPDEQEMQGIEHVMFGHVHPATPYSVAVWLQEAEVALEQARLSRKMPILVGGTGLYFKALLEGLSVVPEIDPVIRRQLREASDHDISLLYRELAELDSVAVSRLEPGDSQRIVRALEVVKSTGKTLSWWQNQKKQKPVLRSDECEKIVLLPDRDVLKARIAHRFANMVDNGAIEEVEKLLELGLGSEMPAMRAIGVLQLANYLEGEFALEKAIELSVIATRQYAKRQMTWFRHQFDETWSRRLIL